MNLTKLFEAQRKLDERIIEEKGLQGQNLIPKKVLALITELGECANEWRGFKFWSSDQEPRDHVRCELCGGHGECYELAAGQTEVCPSCEGDGLKNNENPLLEEYVDCLHFALSIVLDTHNRYSVDVSPMILPTIHRETYFIRAVESCSAIVTASYKEQALHAQQTLRIILGLGQALEFSVNQIEAAYFAKNEINHKRQEEHY